MTAVGGLTTRRMSATPKATLAYGDISNMPMTTPTSKEEKIKDQIKEEIKSFITFNCEKKTEGLSQYLCEFDKTHNTATNAYLLNSEFFKNAKILGEGSFGAVYDSGLWTIDSDSDTVQDIIVKTQKLNVDVNRPDPLFEAYINFVLINTIIMENPGIGLVPTFGLFYCGRKGDMFCANEDGTKIDENNSIFIVQEKKNAKPLSVVRKFTKEMLIQLFEILVKLEKNGIYHCDINDGNILVDETKNDKIYLIDFGLASFMMNQKRIHQRTTYFYNDNDCTAFDDFFAICTLLANYNKELFKIIYPLLNIIIIKFRNPKIDEIKTPFSFYLNQTEDDSYDKRHNLQIYNTYDMIKIYDLVKTYLP